MTDEEFLARLREVFRTEAEEYLARLQAGLSATAGYLDGDLLHAAHGLRGACRSVNEEEMELVSHALEDFFDAHESRSLQEGNRAVLRKAVCLLERLHRGAPDANLGVSEIITAVRSLPSEF